MQKSLSQSSIQKSLSLSRTSSRQRIRILNPAAMHPPSTRINRSGGAHLLGIRLFVIKIRRTSVMTASLPVHAINKVHCQQWNEARFSVLAAMRSPSTRVRNRGGGARLPGGSTLRSRVGTAPRNGTGGGHRGAYLHHEEEGAAGGPAGRPARAGADHSDAGICQGGL